jgi:hypothetical protein
MRFSLATQALAAATASIAALAALPGMAAGDAVYHTQHMALEPVGNAPLRSGFVQNIKANGPTIYAHEVYVLTGAAPRASYTVTNHFFEGSTCAGTEFPTDTALLRTNRAGNGRADVFFLPADVVGLEGIHGVLWTVQNAGDDDPVYQTGCSTVTLD